MQNFHEILGYYGRASKCLASVSERAFFSTAELSSNNAKLDFSFLLFVAKHCVKVKESTCTSDKGEKAR
jgi:hypothetical protein